MSDSNRTRHNESRSNIRRNVAAALGAAALTVMFVPPAMAAKPNHHACLGQDLSTYAQGGSQFGAFVAGMAADGLGTEIQAHLAGAIPDSVIPNSCS